jgi:hypothetical protein
MTTTFPNTTTPFATTPGTPCYVPVWNGSNWQYVIASSFPTTFQRPVEHVSTSPMHYPPINTGAPQNSTPANYPTFNQPTFFQPSYFSSFPSTFNGYGFQQPWSFQQNWNWQTPWNYAGFSNFQNWQYPSFQNFTPNFTNWNTPSFSTPFFNTWNTPNFFNWNTPGFSTPNFWNWNTFNSTPWNFGQNSWNSQCCQPGFCAPNFNTWNPVQNWNSTPWNSNVFCNTYGCFPYPTNYGMPSFNSFPTFQGFPNFMNTPSNVPFAGMPTPAPVNQYNRPTENGDLFNLQRNAA